MGRRGPIVSRANENSCGRRPLQVGLFTLYVLYKHGFLRFTSIQHGTSVFFFIFRQKSTKNVELTKIISFRDFVFVGDIGNLELMLKSQKLGVEVNWHCYWCCFHFFSCDCNDCHSSMTISYQGV